MVGEFEYLTTFIESIGNNNEHTKNPLNPFPEIAATFIFVFLLLMSIILMNLLVGNCTLILLIMFLFIDLFLFIFCLILGCLSYPMACVDVLCKYNDPLKLCHKLNMLN